jgi:hypothetical protein
MFQSSSAEGIAQLVQRSPRDPQKSCELDVLATESFSDVSAHRVRCIFCLRAKLEIFRERVALGQVKDANPNLIRELPCNQFLVPCRSRHAI